MSRQKETKSKSKYIKHRFFLVTKDLGRVRCTTSDELVSISGRTTSNKLTHFQKHPVLKDKMKDLQKREKKEEKGKMKQLQFSFGTGKMELKNSSVDAVVMDSASNNKLSMKLSTELKPVFCAIHRLQRCIVMASTKVGVQPVINQATKLSKKIKKSTS